MSAGARRSGSSKGCRLRHGVVDPERPLGSEPAESARRQERRETLAALSGARVQIERADPAYRSPLRPRGRLEPQEGLDLWAPRSDLGHGPRHGPRHGPSLELGP